MTDRDDATTDVSDRLAAPHQPLHAASRRLDLAFEAQVASIAGDSVTLHVIDRFVGEVAETVVTTQGDGKISDGGPLVYEPGATYLIASVDGRVLSCGQSAVETPELRALYDAAF